MKKITVQQLGSEKPSVLYRMSPWQYGVLSFFLFGLIYLGVSRNLREALMLGGVLGIIQGVIQWAKQKEEKNKANRPKPVI